MKIKGGCACGEIEYSVEDSFEVVGNCHCSQCRKFSGSAYSVLGRVDAEEFVITKGASRLSRFKVSEDTTRVFCGSCGSSLYADKPVMKKVNLRMGTLDGTPTARPSFHVFVGSRAPWHVITDDLVQFEGRRTA